MKPILTVTFATFPFAVQADEGAHHHPHATEFSWIIVAAPCGLGGTPLRGGANDPRRNPCRCWRDYPAPVSHHSIQVGSHYHFAEANAGLLFDCRVDHGQRLDIPAATAVRFEPGQTREVRLIPYGGARVVYGFNGAVMGTL